MSIIVSSSSKNLTDVARDLKTLGYKVLLYTPYRVAVYYPNGEKLEQIVGLIQLLTGAQITVTNN